MKAKCPYCEREINVTPPSKAEEADGVRNVCPLCHHPFKVFGSETYRLMQQTPDMRSISLEEPGDCYIEVVDSQLSDERKLALPRGTERSFGRFQTDSSVDMQILTRDSTLDRCHAYFAHDRKGRITVRDAGSSKGTYVNGELLPPGERRLLEDGDVVSMGHTTVIVSTGEEE